MTVQLPTRITIELRPDGDVGGWTAHTSVVDRHAPLMAPAVAPLREEAPGPAAYEPSPCTCLEADGCAADHANE
jgi:hypothetical protein